MSEHHFFVEPPGIVDGVVTLEGEEGRHASRVLRVRPGEAITVADGSGRMILATVREADDVVIAEVVKEAYVAQVRPAITVFQALAKKDRFDAVVEKATEVGVVRIVPFAAERSVVRFDEKKMSRSVDRWSAIARAAAKQSKAARIPEVALPGSIETFAQLLGLRIALHEASDRPLRDALPPEPPDELALLVGPEGGLSEREVNVLTDAGADVVTLGPRVLRTETAGTVAAAIIAFVYGSLG
ncbi:MAG: 16S rRNA (uracil(1498)-N(3))-methyltransferase [Actinomycetota bacterium]